MYAAYIFLANRLLRTIYSNISYVIRLEELPHVDRILNLCNEIYLVRENNLLRLEEQLVAKLFFLYRSSETMIKWTRHPKYIIDKFTDKPELPPSQAPPPPRLDLNSGVVDDPDGTPEWRTSHENGLTGTFGVNQSGSIQCHDHTRLLSSSPMANPFGRFRCRRSVVESPGDGTEGNETRRRSVRVCGHGRQSSQDVENNYPMSSSAQRTDTARASPRKPSR